MVFISQKKAIENWNGFKSGVKDAWTTMKKTLAESDIWKKIKGGVQAFDQGTLLVYSENHLNGFTKIGENLYSKQVEKDEKVLSPGMKYRHYAPESRCLLVNCENDLDQVFYLKKFIKEVQGNVVVIGFEEHKDKLLLDDERFISMGNKSDLDNYAKNIYSALRKADLVKPRIILIEGVKKQGLGFAIMNRLIRTCENNVFER